MVTKFEKEHTSYLKKCPHILPQYPNNSFFKEVCPHILPNLWDYGFKKKYVHTYCIIIEIMGFLKEVCAYILPF